MEVQNLEGVWVQIRLHGHTILVAGISMPPNAGQIYWMLIQESKDRTRNVNINDIVIVGDLVAREVSDPFIPNMVRYCFPIAAILKFLKPQLMHFNLNSGKKYEQGNYNKYTYLLTNRQNDLNDVVSNTDENMDRIADKINSNILVLLSKAHNHNSNQSLRCTKHNKSIRARLESMLIKRSSK